MTEKVRGRIKNEVKGRSKQCRSIFGVSIQFVMNGKVGVRSLGMTELLDSRTGVHLAAVLCARLKDYGIDLKQILTVTTDNGANVLKILSEQKQLQKPFEYARQKWSKESRDSFYINSCKYRSNSLWFAICMKFYKMENSQALCPLFEQTDDADSNEIDDLISKLLKSIVETSDEDAIQMMLDDMQTEHQESLLTAMSKRIVVETGLDYDFELTGVNCVSTNSDFDSTK